MSEKSFEKKMVMGVLCFSDALCLNVLTSLKSESDLSVTWWLVCVCVCVCVCACAHIVIQVTWWLVCVCVSMCVFACVSVCVRTYTHCYILLLYSGSFELHVFLNC